MTSTKRNPVTTTSTSRRYEPYVGESRLRGRWRHVTRGQGDLQTRYDVEGRLMWLQGSPDLAIFAPDGA
jgi:hypothetical protein